MASSTAMVSPSPPKPYFSDIDDGGNDSEYEEIEVEVEEEIEVEIEEEIEVEVEEEIEEEVEEIDEEAEAKKVKGDDDDEIGEDLTPIREENGQNDTTQNVELEEHEDRIQSGSIAQGLFFSNPLIDISSVQTNVGGVKTSESSEKEESRVNGERTSKDNNPMALFDDNGGVNHSRTIPFIGDVNASSVIGKKDNANVPTVAATNHTVMEGVPNIRQMSPRLHVPRFRDPSSSAEFNRGNKKLKMICEFHAKGWCIKGNSCRFLHIKDGLDAFGKNREVLEREASSSASIPPENPKLNSQSEENPKLNSQTEELVLRKDETLGSAPLQDDGGSFGHNLCVDNFSYSATPLVKGSLIARSSAYHEIFSVTSHDNHPNARISAPGAIMDEMIGKKSDGKKSDVVRSGPRLADLPYSNPRRPLYFDSSSWNANAHGAQKFWESSLEHCVSVSSSLRQSIPPISCSESESRSRYPANSKTMFSSFDWEPSLPFRPSHVITQKLLLKESLYDPIRDSVDQKDVGDGRMKFSDSDQGSSVKNVNIQPNIVLEEEKLLDSGRAGNAMKDNILTSRGDDKFDKVREEAVIEVDGSGKINEEVVDFKRDGHMQSESKAVKFQPALIERVKELVKPTWLQGCMSRDTHKLIVKKAVDKVLSTLQPDQIPRTSESIKLYLSSSQAKLDKLVEGYISKYGKS